MTPPPATPTGAGRRTGAAGRLLGWAGEEGSLRLKALQLAGCFFGLQVGTAGRTGGLWVWGCGCFDAFGGLHDGVGEGVGVDSSRYTRTHIYTHTHPPPLKPIPLTSTTPPKHQASYITWGVVQERVMTQAYGEGDAAEFFPSSAVRYFWLLDG